MVVIVMSVKLKDVYRAEHSVAKSPATDQDLEGSAVPTGKAVRLESLYAVDLTTAGKTVRLGYSRAGVNYWFKRNGSGASGYGAALDQPIILVEGEKPIARVESATANDELLMVASGVYL